MKIFDGMQSFFNSIGEYVKNFSNLFFIFLGVFVLISVIVIILTSFSYECMLTKTIDKINKFLERNPRINDDNLVAFNNLMKASRVPKTLRRQWQQFMLYREHPASYYMSFKHCVENPLRNSIYKQEMTVYKIISYLLVALSAVASTFMAVQSFNANLVLQDIIIIPMTILVGYWLISMVLDLIHSAISSDLFQNYQYFEINMDKAMLTLPEFVDYEVLFSQDEIRRGIPVLFAYLQKRAIQEQQELEKARLKNVDHEKFDFDEAGLDASLVLDRAMRETENFSSQRKKYMQEIERVNNEILVLENNYKEQVKEYQRQVQTSKETVENLKEQLEQASSTIEINYIKKQMRDEINRQQVAEKDFDILTDKHNQEVKSLNQEIKHYDEETKKAKEALEVAMLSEFNTYSVKVYDNLEKIVDEKMQGKVDDYKEQIKGLEGQLEEKNEELENVYTRYQEVLSQTPIETQPIEETYTQIPLNKGKKKKKSAKDEEPIDDGMVQPEQLDENTDYAQYDDQYTQEYSEDVGEQPFDYDNQDYSYDNQKYVADDQYQEGDYITTDDNYQPMDENYVPVEEGYEPMDDNYQPTDDNYVTLDENYIPTSDEQYVPLTEEYQESNNYNDNAEYVPLDDDYNTNNEQYVPLDQEYVPMDDESQQEENYVPLDDQYTYQEDNNNQYVPLSEEKQEVYIPLDEENADNSTIDKEDNDFDDTDFDIDFSKQSTKNKADNIDDMDFESIFGDKKEDKSSTPAEKDLDEVEFDINNVLGIYDNVSSEKIDNISAVGPVEENVAETDTVDDIIEENETEEDELDGDLEEDELPAPIIKRKAGRPRKIIDEDEVKPKRGVGRPRKIVDDEGVLEAPRRSVGRPKKETKETEELGEPKRRVGRPRKQQTEVAEKRSVGRPRKEKTEIEQPKRKAGRPRKEEKRGVGRPRKIVDETVLEESKRKVGRPKKEKSDTIILEAPKRSVGRPKKVKNETEVRKVGRPKKENLTTIVDKPKGKRGRPRKN